ncbi:hypothetical protein F5Y10DRAFT_241936 [Nemania abortiva]|nr:hypothetical protein F5Y10DRAFT_241936 [Nemania abortiva]
MLPSRGLARNPASALRYSLSSRIKHTRTIPTRQFSQAQSQSSVLSRHGLPRTNTSLLHGQTTPSIAAIRSGVPVGIASSVFAQRSGAARNLSLWPFQSKPKSPPSTETLPERTEALAAEAQPQPQLQPPVDNEPSTLSASAETTSNAADFSSSLDQLSDDFARDLDPHSFVDIPERIGFLEDFGLDFGWGTTTCCEWLLEHIYVYSGLPWWGSIAAVAFLFRAVMFIPTLRASRHQAKLQKVQGSPAYVKAMSDMNDAAFRTKDQAAMMAARTEMRRIMQESGASQWKSMVGLATVPFTFGMFRLLRGMAEIPVPSLETGGMAWFTDLSVADPYFIMPSISVAITLLVLKQTQRANVNPNPNPTQEIMMKGMVWVMPPLMFLGTAWLPAAVQWFFLMLSLTTVVQTGATLTPAVRRWAQLPPLLNRDAIAAKSSLAAGIQYQSPSRSLRDTLQQSAEAATTGLKQATGATDEKARWKKAEDYEERRAEEEREKAARRIDEIRRRRAERQR